MKVQTAKPRMEERQANCPAEFADLRGFVPPEFMLLRCEDYTQTRECVCRIWGTSGEQVGSGESRISPPVSGNALNAMGCGPANVLLSCGVRWVRYVPNCSWFLLQPAGKTPGWWGFWLTPGEELCKINM